ncbi:MASE1 domain-containing protein [Dyella jejuensis]|uniref:MASE1 domain-containing protein n=1 Tax=Dyella jejuensis TaxID=1432009 RepID=A0ABW8JG15_9GAMM
MKKQWWTNDWLVQLGVAVGYALLYVLIHPLSSAHWPVHAGIRLACLLLMPYRFWPALLIGEALPNAYEVFPCLDSLGPTWVAVRSLPPFAVAMPIVWWCRTRMPPFPSHRLIDMKAMITCALLVALGGMVYSSLAYSVSLDNAETLSAEPVIAFGYFLGPYLAIFSILPWVLMAKLDYHPGHLREQLHKILSSRLSLDVVVLLIPTLAVLSWLNLIGSVEFKQVAPMIMFLPIAWLTIKHGWRAAAVGGPLAIACISLSSQFVDYPDPKTVATQTFLVIAITCLFSLGARISAQLLQEEEEKHSALNVQRLARQSFQLGEQRMRQTSQALEYLAGNLHITNGRLLEQMRRIVPNIESHAFYKQALATQNQVYRLAESMHPIAWRERGLPAALNETIARALDEAGIAYRCEINGRGFSRLAPSVLTATYRAACEAVVYVSSRLACTRVKLMLRGGETNGKRWVVLRVEGILEDTGVANAVYLSEERQRLASKLGASALDVAEMRDHVSIFDGGMHVRRPQDRLQITVLLQDITQEARRVPSAPVRLWVK